MHKKNRIQTLEVVGRSQGKKNLRVRGREKPPKRGVSEDFEETRPKKKKSRKKEIGLKSPTGVRKAKTRNRNPLKEDPLHPGTKAGGENGENSKKKGV